jgi:hypothetical protein
MFYKIIIGETEYRVKSKDALFEKLCEVAGAKYEKSCVDWKDEEAKKTYFCEHYKQNKSHYKCYTGTGKRGRRKKITEEQEE